MIQLDSNTWIIMRDNPKNPTAIVSCVRDTNNEARYLLMTWHLNPAQRRLAGIYTTLQDADHAVKWDRTRANEAMRKNDGPPNGRWQQKTAPTEPPTKR